MSRIIKWGLFRRHKKWLRTMRRYRKFVRQISTSDEDDSRSFSPSGVQMRFQEIFTKPYSDASRRRVASRAVERIPDGPTVKLIAGSRQTARKWCESCRSTRKSRTRLLQLATVIDADGTLSWQIPQDSIPARQTRFWEKFSS